MKHPKAARFALWVLSSLCLLLAAALVVGALHVRSARLERNGREAVALKFLRIGASQPYEFLPEQKIYEQGVDSIKFTVTSQGEYGFMFQLGEYSNNVILRLEDKRYTEYDKEGNREWYSEGKINTGWVICETSGPISMMVGQGLRPAINDDYPGDYCREFIMERAYRLEPGTYCLVLIAHTAAKTDVEGDIQQTLCHIVSDPFIIE